MGGAGPRGLYPGAAPGEHRAGGPFGGRRLRAAAGALAVLGCLAGIFFAGSAALAAVTATSYTFEASSGGPTATGTASCSNNAASRRSGSYGLAVASGSTASNASGCYLTTVGSEPASTVVYATGWAAAASTAATAQLCVRFTTAGGASVQCGSMGTLGSTFQQLTAAVSVPSSASAVSVFLTGALVTSGTVYWDDVTISDVAPASATPTPTATATATPTPTPTPTPSSQPTPAPTASPSSGAVTVSGPVSLDPDQWNGLALILLASFSLILFLLAISVSKTLFGR